MKTLSRRRLLEGAAFGAAAISGLGATRARAAAAPAADFGLATLVDGDGIELMGRATGPAEIQFRLWKTGDSAHQTVTPWIATTHDSFTAKARLFAPGGDLGYSWRFNVRDPANPAALNQSASQRIRSRPAVGADGSFSFVFASCTGNPNPLAAAAIAALQPLFTAWIGDFGYPDDDPGVVHTKLGLVANLRRFFGSDSFRRIAASSAWQGQADDHDLDRDEATRLTAPAYAMEAWADVVPGYGYPGPTCRTWQVGHARFWMLDCRRYADDPRAPSTWQNGDFPSVLGAAQRQWLAYGLAASPARAKFVLSPMSTVYGRWRPEELSILQAAGAASKTPVVWLAGDRHAAAYTVSGGISELLASPVKNQKATVPVRPGTLWTNDLDGDGMADFNCFGYVSVTPAAAILRVIRENGAVMFETTVTT